MNTLYIFLIKGIKFLAKNWKTTLLVMMAIIFISYFGKTIQNYLFERESKQILECNEDKLNAQIKNLQRELEIERQSKDLINEELQRIEIENNVRRNIIRQLESALKNSEKLDGLISERTREFYLQTRDELENFYDVKTFDTNN